MKYLKYLRIFESTEEGMLKDMFLNMEDIDCKLNFGFSPMSFYVEGYTSKDIGLLEFWGELSSSISRVSDEGYEISEHDIKTSNEGNNNSNLFKISFHKIDNIDIYDITEIESLCIILNRKYGKYFSKFNKSKPFLSDRYTILHLTRPAPKRPSVDISFGSYEEDTFYLSAYAAGRSINWSGPISVSDILEKNKFSKNEIEQIKSLTIEEDVAIKINPENIKKLINVLEFLKDK